VCPSSSRTSASSLAGSDWQEVRNAGYAETWPATYDEEPPMNSAAATVMVRDFCLSL